MLGHLTPAPSPIGQFLFSSDEQESTSLKTRISDFLRDQERRGGAKPKMGKVLRHHPYATSTPRPPRFNSASPLPKLDDLLHQTDLPSLHASFPSLLDRPQRPRMSDFHDRTHFQPYAPSLQYLPHYQPPPTHTHFPQPPCCPNYYQNPYYPVPMTSVQNYQPHYAPSFSEFHNPAPPSLDEYRAMVAAASRRRERPVWESQSLEDSLSDIRRVLNELVPGDASEDSGRPSTSASPHSPQSQGSGGVITLDDGPLEGDSGSREESGGKGRLSTEYLVRMEHGLDVNPRGILRTLDGWRDKLSVRDIHADNLQRELKLFAELRLKKDRLADKDLRERLRLQGIVIPEIELLDLEEAEEEPEELPELPEEAEDLIQSALNAPDKKKIVEMNNTPITPHDLKTLIGLNWLNDEVMNYYITMIQERSKKEGMAKIHCFNTFFYPKLDSGGHGSLKRWTRRIDIFAMDLVLAPIHLGVHWCLAVMDLVNKEVRYYDSMGGPNDHCLHLLKDYLEAEHQDKKKSPLDMSEWKLINVKDIPQQKNGSDCGMFSLKFADYISAGKPIDFTQEDMPYFRRRMMYEILTSQLMW